MLAGCRKPGSDDRTHPSQTEVRDADWSSDGQKIVLVQGLDSVSQSLTLHPDCFLRTN